MCDLKLIEIVLLLLLVETAAVVVAFVFLLFLLWKNSLKAAAEINFYARLSASSSPFFAFYLFSLFFFFAFAVLCFCSHFLTAFALCINHPSGSDITFN